ncbi:MAG: SPOR domain-containing protein [Gallionella sp.]
MGNNRINKSTALRQAGNALWTGIFVGVLVGVCMAAGVAWYLMKSPSPFTNKEPPKPDLTKPATSAATEKPAAPSGEGKQRFDFYKVLTDKKDATVSTKPTDKPQGAKSTSAKSQAANSKPAVAYEPQILQAGSFASVNEAENLKAKLALLGVEANIQTATIPDKGVWYRVRVGPYKSAGEMNHARGFLKQNGVESTPMRAQ